MDVSVCADPRISEDTFQEWATHMEQNGVTREKAYDHFSTWKKEEHYFSLQEELNALSEAGFVKPECFWRKGPLAIYGALT